MFATLRGSKKGRSIISPSEGDFLAITCFLKGDEAFAGEVEGPHSAGISTLRLGRNHCSTAAFC